MTIKCPKCNGIINKDYICYVCNNKGRIYTVTGNTNKNEVLQISKQRDCIG